MLLEEDEPSTLSILKSITPTLDEVVVVEAEVVAELDLVAVMEVAEEEEEDLVVVLMDQAVLQSDHLITVLELLAGSVAEVEAERE